MNFQYLIIFYGVELVPKAGKKNPVQERRFEPFIKEFKDYDAAVAWAKKHVDAFLFSKNGWFVKLTEVFSVKEISSHSRLMQRMDDNFKKEIKNSLAAIIHKFLDAELESKYLQILLHSQKNKSFRSDTERHQDSAKFALPVVRKNCEKEMGEYHTFFAGDFNSTVLEILESYFSVRENEQKALTAAI